MKNKRQPNTWKKDFEYTDVMSQRIQLMLSLIHLNEINSFMDIGCGKQTSKKYLPENINYYPVDQYQKLETTIVMDLNKGEFLNQPVDLCFCSGVFEYIYNLDELVGKISKITNKVLCSYCTKEYRPQRLLIWVNSFTRNEFVIIFQKYGFELKKEFSEEDPIFLFEK